VDHVLRCVLASDARCIPLGRRRLVPVPSVWVPGFRLLDRFVPGVVRERLRAGPDSATFHAV
jgi:hypothetical protein